MAKRLSVEESAVDQQQRVEMEEASPQNRWLCNELVHELCKEIPTAKTAERILLTSHNIYAYLVPRFRKMRLIYRDAIGFFKAKLNANKQTRIRIGEVAQNKGSKPIVGINGQSDDLFVLKTNHLDIRISDSNDIWNRKVVFSISNKFDNFENAHLHYFLRLIAPLVRPIHLDFHWSKKPIKDLMRFLNALSGCIESIEFNGAKFNSAKSDEALGKYNKLKLAIISGNVDVPKLVHWLTTPNNNNDIGQSKKYLNLWCFEVNDATVFLKEVKKDFARATIKRRFFVRIKLEQQLDEFIVCNEWTGENLELRHMYTKKVCFIHAICRFPNNEMDNIEGDFAEFDPYKMTTILL